MKRLLSIVIIFLIACCVFLKVELNAVGKRFVTFEAQSKFRDSSFTDWMHVVKKEFDRSDVFIKEWRIESKNHGKKTDKEIRELKTLVTQWIKESEIRRHQSDSLRENYLKNKPKEDSVWNEYWKKHKG